jgi:hypothetical protein
MLTASSHFPPTRHAFLIKHMQEPVLSAIAGAATRRAYRPRAPRKTGRTLPVGADFAAEFAEGCHWRNLRQQPRMR